MSSGRLSAGALAAALAVAGCGAGSDRTPRLSDLPMLPGATIVAQVTRCDKGANAFCAIDLVVVDKRYRSSEAVVKAQHALLKRRGWSSGDADIGGEDAGDAPGHKLRVTYGTAFVELTAVDLGWIERPKPITRALSREVFAGAPSMAVLLEIGNG
jgi:hypothetical protein